MPSETKHSKLYKVLAQEMTKMLARNLRYAPAADELPIVVSVMEEDLLALGYKDDDIERIVYAINQVGRATDDWPTVNTIRKNILTRDQFSFRTQPYKMIEQKPPTEEERAKIKKVMDKIKNDILKKEKKTDSKEKEKKRRKDEFMAKHLASPYGTMPQTIEEIIEAQKEQAKNDETPPENVKEYVIKREDNL